MLYPSHFSHQLIRKYLVAFGSFFDKMTVLRNDTQKIVVPVQYGPKERWLTRLVQDPKFAQGVGQIVPRISYQLESISYDSGRKLDTLNRLTFPAQSSEKALSRLYVGVPYTLNITMAILTKYQSDAFQLVEQILPFFTPDLQFAMEVIPELGLVDQIPLILTSVTQSDNYEGDFEHRRAIVWTLAFDMRVNLYGPNKAQKRIEEVVVDLYNTTGLLADPILVDLEDASIIALEPESMEVDDLVTTIGTLGNRSADSLTTAGRVVDEATANTTLTTGRVARITATVLDSPTELPVDSITTVTEANGDILRNSEGNDESI